MIIYKEMRELETHYVCHMKDLVQQLGQAEWYLGEEKFQPNAQRSKGDIETR
jgi:hypothetical protein